MLQTGHPLASLLSPLAPRSLANKRKTADIGYTLEPRSFNGELIIDTAYITEWPAPLISPETVFSRPRSSIPRAERFAVGCDWVLAHDSTTILFASASRSLRVHRPIGSVVSLTIFFPIECTIAEI